MRERENVAINVVKGTSALEGGEKVVELLLVGGGRTIYAERNDSLYGVEVVEVGKEGRLFLGGRKGYMNVIVVFAS